MEKECYWCFRKIKNGDKFLRITLPVNEDKAWLTKLIACEMCINKIQRVLNNYIKDET